jgi:hypothetical protein
VFNGSRGLLLRSANDHHGAGFRACGGFNGHHRAGHYARLLFHGRFQILRMQVHARRGHNNLALAAQKAKFASGFGLGQVARGQPLVGARMQRSA